MNIIGTQFTLSTKSFEIYIAGCAGQPHCRGCHNPESWDFNQGELFNEEMFFSWKRKIKEFDGLIDNIMIFGGEPLDQEQKRLKQMLSLLNSLKKQIWLFTRYSLEEANEIMGETIFLLNYIKCGQYEEDMRTNDNKQYGIQLATSNQIIYKIIP